MGHSHRTTLHRRIGPGRILREGSERPYRELRLMDGEAHLIREELTGPGWRAPAAGRRRCLLCFAHVTDLQIADVQSPARFEFFNRDFDDPRLAEIVPVQRPQEALVVHAVEALVGTLNGLGASPVTAAPLSLVVTTGDAIDNAQWNEMRTFLALLEGGRVHPDSGGPSYEGVQSLHWPDRVFWRPDGPTPLGEDLWRERYGFPYLPGLLPAALAAFDAPGLELPWLACFGNHEALVQGVGALTRPVLEYLVGGRKPVDPPEGMDREGVGRLFTDHPEAFLSGRSLPVTADVSRRGVTRGEFVAAHLGGAGRPAGHGFSIDNLRDGTAYYAYDEPSSGVRMIGLDTTCLQGGADGRVDAVQARWLERRLAEVHSRYRGAGGAEHRTSNEDRPVVVFSHHGPATMAGSRAPAPGGEEPDAPLGGRELVALLHRFPNVVLWLNGHRHINQVTPRPGPWGSASGFWEVSTCSVMDWPCQARLVELVDNSDGTLSVLCTMVDHDAPARPSAARGRRAFAALHRELASNVPWAGPGTRTAGTPADRNVDLPLAFPAGCAGRGSRS